MAANLNRTNTVYILTIVIMAVIIVVLAVNNQSIRKELVGGTIRKVNYSKTMTEEDKTARNQISGDQAGMAKALRTLLDYNVFEKTVSQSLESMLQELSNGKKLSQKDLQSAKDLDQFIRKNHEVIMRTITMLMEFYTRDTSEVSSQVVKNLTDFNSYVNELKTKNASIGSAGQLLDDLINENDEAFKRNDQLTKLEEVRAQIVPRNISKVK